jgi:hypothetical protein
MRISREMVSSGPHPDAQAEHEQGELQAGDGFELVLLFCHVVSFGCCAGYFLR